MTWWSDVYAAHVKPNADLPRRFLSEEHVVKLVDEQTDEQLIYSAGITGTTQTEQTLLQRGHSLVAARRLVLPRTQSRSQTGFDAAALTLLKSTSTLSESDRSTGKIFLKHKTHTQVDHGLMLRSLLELLKLWSFAKKLE